MAHDSVSVAAKQICVFWASNNTYQLKEINSTLFNVTVQIILT